MINIFGFSQPQSIIQKNISVFYFYGYISSLYRIQFKVNNFRIEVVSWSKILLNIVKDDIL